MTAKILRLSFLGIISMLYSGFVHAQEVELSNRLQNKINLSGDDYLHISILLSDRIDILALESTLKKEGLSLEERTKILLLTLQDKAANTQGDLINFLRSNPEVMPSSIHSYWLSNIVYAKVKKTVIADLSKRKDIERMDLNGQFQLVDDFRETSTETSIPNSVEPGLRAIRADELWKMGYSGRGTFALGADTGIDPSHPSIDGQYRGLYFDNEQTWYHWDNFSREPYDCDNHGTHTIGTIMGLDRNTNDTIGVAPNATYTGANIIVCSATGGSQDNMAAFQWAIDPDGDPNTVDDIPDAINNSWHDPEADPCAPEYTDAFQVMEAVGIAVVFAAGNDGSDPRSITFPKNINYDEVNCFSVGALDAATANFEIAGFSSRGPSQCGGQGSIAIKPEVSAPGVDVRSAIVGGGYAEFSGTSMAAPHVVGAILLLKEAFPYLTGRDLKYALYNTCRDLGSPGEDNTYGRGIIDVKEAFDYLVNEGNQPTNPRLSRDIVLYDLGIGEDPCQSMFSPKIKIENLGVDTVLNLNIKFEISALNWDTTLIWTGRLAPGERSTLSVLNRHFAPGFYAYSAEIIEVNGQDDEYRYNNRLERFFETFPPIDLTLVNSIPSDTLCKHSIVDLTAELLDYEKSEDEEIIWYDQANGGNFLGSGSSFQTPPLQSTQQYYAQLVSKQHLGPESNEIGSNFQIEGRVAGGIRFDSKALTLKSVKVYLEKRGLLSIALRDQAGNMLKLKQQVITQIGEHVIQLDFDVPQGKNLSLEAWGLIMPLINTSGANFPYELPGGMVLKENTIDFGEGAYFCFYDWQVELPLLCERSEIKIPITDLNSNFIMSTSEAELTDAEIQFTDQSVAAEHHLWNFGDGNSSTEVNPQHRYRSSGTFLVEQIVEDLHQCSDTSYQELIVLDTLSDVMEQINTSLRVYPNPATDQLFVEGDLPVPTEIVLRNTLGQVVLRTTSIGSSTTIDIKHLRKGVYLLQYEHQMVKFLKVE